MRALSQLATRLDVLERSKTQAVTVVNVRGDSGGYLSPEDARKAKGAEAAGGLLVCIRRFATEVRA